jgi:hypothetical protein
MNIFKIVVAPAVYTQLKLGNLTYSSQKEARDVVRKACKEKGWEPSETTEDNCIVFRNEHGGEIVRVVSVSGVHCRKPSTRDGR